MELAGTEPVEQEPWQPKANDEGMSIKNVPLGEHDRLYMEAYARPDYLEEEYDPSGVEIRKANNLAPTHNFQFKRFQGPNDTTGSMDITGGGKAGLVISHMTQAIRDLLAKRPMSVYFTGSGPSRMKTYMHMMRRLEHEGAGGGEYKFLVRNGREGPDQDSFGSYHIVHQAAAHMPRTGICTRFPCRRKWHLPARRWRTCWPPGRSPAGLRRTWNGVAMANTYDLQEKTIAPAIDYMGPDGLSCEDISPGMKILMELRARRAAGPVRVTPT